jgi:predicted nucleic acid-binding protein
MNQPYLDTGLVLKLVVDEPLSETVLAWLQSRNVPIPYTRLVEMEVENTLCAKLFRKEFKAQDFKKARGMVQDLLKDGMFFRPKLSLDEVFLESLEVMSVATVKTGCRTLDLLHVVSASMLGCSEFVTSDKRQAAAAKTYGLKVILLGEG